MDIIMTTDPSHLSLLALFHVSSAFDMVDHEILLQSLQLSCGISNIPLPWFKSYLSATDEDLGEDWGTVLQNLRWGTAHASDPPYFEN